MKLPDESKNFEGPNLTPVIDVVFLLLIFFLVATRYDQEERELNVVLPEVTQAQPLSMTPELVINVMRDGKYRIVQQEMTEQQLREEIEAQAIQPDEMEALRSARRRLLIWAASR